MILVVISKSYIEPNTATAISVTGDTDVWITNRSEKVLRITVEQMLRKHKQKTKSQKDLREV